MLANTPFQGKTLNKTLLDTIDDKATEENANPTTESKKQKITEANGLKDEGALSSKAESTRTTTANQPLK